MAKCLLCPSYNRYTGKTVTTLHERLNKHRSSFTLLNKKLRRSSASTPVQLDIDLDDEQILGAHLILKHELSAKNAFDKNYEISIVGHCNPSNIRMKEQFFMDKLKTLFPYGLNQCQSIGD